MNVCLFRVFLTYTTLVVKGHRSNRHTVRSRYQVLQFKNTAEVRAPGGRPAHEPRQSSQRRTPDGADTAMGTARNELRASTAGRTRRPRRAGATAGRRGAGRAPVVLVALGTSRSVDSVCIVECIYW